MGRYYEEEELNMDLAPSGANREKYFTEELFQESRFFTSPAKN